MSRRVVITGLGPVTSIGIGKEAFWQSLMNMTIATSAIPNNFEEHYKFNSRFYVPLPRFSLTDYGFQSKYNYLMSDTSKISVLCAKLALMDAGFNIKEKDFKLKEFENSAIIIGVSMSGYTEGVSSYLVHLLGTNSDVLKYNNRSTSFDRMVIPMAMPNSAASWISILFGIKGINYTVNASCASGNYALGEAYNKIKSGQYNMVIAGGVDSYKDVSGALMRGFDAVGALTKSEDGRPMPFSKKRSGFLYSEGGGCVLILEELESAIYRGACIYAEIVGFQGNSDAYSIMQIDQSGKQIERIIRHLIKNNTIDYFNAHGTGTVQNDALEATIIQNIFGSKNSQPLINSTKSFLGHTIGASASLEAAVCAMSIRCSKLHANLSDNTIENLNLVLNTMDANIDTALSCSYGFGGHNSAILLKKCI